MLVVRCPSSSPVKLTAIKRALDIMLPREEIDLRGLPVELQVRPDRSINAQPEGADETIDYTRERWYEMCRLYGVPINLDINIESGAIHGKDVAAVTLYSVWGDEVIVLSEGVVFPPGALEEARRRGFKTTTAGDIIHEWFPHIPSNNWQGHFPPYKSREDLIMEAILNALRRLRTY